MLVSNIPVPDDLVIAIISGAAVQLLDTCRMLDGDLEAAEQLAWQSIRTAREQLTP